MGDACMDAGGRATQDAQAEGKGGGEKETSCFNQLSCQRLPPPPRPLPPREGEIDFEGFYYTSMSQQST
jgi:hypothetical protein